MSEKLLEMRHFRAVQCPEEPGLAPPGPPESFGMERNEKNGSDIVLLGHKMWTCEVANGIRQWQSASAR